MRKQIIALALCIACTTMVAACGTVQRTAARPSDAGAATSPQTASPLNTSNANDPAIYASCQAFYPQDHMSQSKTVLDLNTAETGISTMYDMGQPPLAAQMPSIRQWGAKLEKAVGLSSSGTPLHTALNNVYAPFAHAMGSGTATSDQIDNDSWNTNLTTATNICKAAYGQSAGN